MKIKSFRIKNFRGYVDSGVIEFDALTAFIGKNDAGKSTVLDALNIFFNPTTQKVDKDDVNVKCKGEDNRETVFDICFCDLPKEIDIDKGGTTTLQDEYLLNTDGCFEVIMRVEDGGKPKIFVFANHPSNSGCAELLKKKNADLKKIVEKLKLECDQRTNASMRKAIWTHFGNDLQLTDQEIAVDSKDGEIKAIWDKLQVYLPVYSLFKSDRSNDDKDAEVQDPLKTAVQTVVKDIGLQTKLDVIFAAVKDQLEDVSRRTCEKVKEMAPDVAESLHPKLAAPKWADVFTKGISITGDQDIPLAKRGSGVRRLILLNFFRAEAERKKDEKGAPDVIYAIEEPETSQHANFQIKLMDAFKSLATCPSVQVIITTHSSTIVNVTKESSIRIVIKKEDGATTVKKIDMEGRALPGLSLHEICYLSYGAEASVEYHDELYGALWVIAKSAWELEPHKDRERFDEDAFDKFLNKKGVACTRDWERDDKPSTKRRTLQTYIRNKIHHPENTKVTNKMFTVKELAESVDKMRELLLSDKKA